MHRGIACALLWAAGVVVHGQTDVDADALLDKIKAQAEANLTRLPDYICQQTVERTTRDAPEEEFRRLDTIRLEVGLIGDRELYAWPNSQRFEDQDLSDLIQRGAIGNGSFATHARNVFLTSIPDFHYRGEEEVEGVRTIRFDYEVTADRSTYLLRVPPMEAIIPFQGSFWVDAESLDLVRLRVVADQIPPELGVVDTKKTLEYARVPIGESDFLLPSASQLEIRSVDGVMSRNQTSFSGCRRYVSESSIRFGRPTTDRPPVAPNSEFKLPPHVSLEMKLDTEIDSRSAAIGDTVRALIDEPVTDGDEILIPKGAVVHGRLVRLERYDHPVGHYVVGLEFHSVEFDGLRTPVSATMRKASGSSALMKESKTLMPTFGKKRKAFMQVLVNEQQRGQGIIHWKADKPIVSRGLKMQWETDPDR